MTGNHVWLGDPQPYGVASTASPYTSHRVARIRWNILNQRDARLDELRNVTSGDIEKSIFKTIRSGGSMTVEYEFGAMEPDWKNIRVQPWHVLELPDGSELEEPIGVFVLRTPKPSYTEDSKQTSFDLFDKLQILDEVSYNETFALPAGTVVTTAIRDVILSATDSRIAVTESDDVLRTALVWDTSSTKLEIVNQLLQAIDYFALWVDGHGTYRADPRVEPQKRPIRWEFHDDEQSIYEADYTREEDDFSIPNMFRAVSKTDGEEEPLIAVALNENPESPYSYPSRGQWIVKEERDVDITTQVALQAYVDRRLKESSQTQITTDITHAYIPLELNEAIAFRDTRTGIEERAVVRTIKMRMDATELVQTNILKVAD